MAIDSAVGTSMQALSRSISEYRRRPANLRHFGVLLAILGCLPAFVLPVLAAWIGYMLAGSNGAVWGGVAGFVVGVAFAVATAWFFTTLKER